MTQQRVSKSNFGFMFVYSLTQFNSNQTTEERSLGNASTFVATDFQLLLAPDTEVRFFNAFFHSSFPVFPNVHFFAIIKWRDFHFRFK